MTDTLSFVLYLCSIVQLSFGILILINNRGKKKGSNILLKPLVATILALSFYPFFYLIYLSNISTLISTFSERLISTSGSILCSSIVIFLSRLRGEESETQQRRNHVLVCVSSALVLFSIYPGFDVDHPAPLSLWNIQVGSFLTWVYLIYIFLCTLIFIHDFKNAKEKTLVYRVISGSLLFFALATLVFDAIPYIVFDKYSNLLVLAPTSGLVFSGTLYWACAKKNFFRLRESLNLLSLIILTMLVSTGFVIPLGQQPLIKAIIITICVGLVIDVWRKDTRLKSDYRRAKKKIKLLTAEQQGASSYIMDIAHRLKSPLAAVQHLMMGMRTKPAAEQSKLDRARSIVADTARAMKNLLLSGKIDHRDASISRAPFDLAAALREWREEWQALCAGNPVELTLAASKMGVDADRNALKDALTNLVDNARKHSPTGAPISVELKLYDGSAEIAVTDRGPGLPTNVQSLIFQRHYQHKTGPNRESSSSAGLGLHLAKWVAEQHGGEIRVHSRPNRGATFTISLPRPRQEVAEQIDRKPPRWSSRRVQIKTLRPQ